MGCLVFVVGASRGPSLSVMFLALSGLVVGLLTKETAVMAPVLASVLWPSCWSLSQDSRLGCDCRRCRTVDRLWSLASHSHCGTNGLHRCAIKVLSQGGPGSSVCHARGAVERSDPRLRSCAWIDIRRSDPRGGGHGCCGQTVSCWFLDCEPPRPLGHCLGHAGVCVPIH